MPQLSLLRKLKLHEISLVRHPANPHARVLLTKATMPNHFRTFIDSLRDSMLVLAKSDEEKAAVTDGINKAEAALAVDDDDASALGADAGVSPEVLAALAKGGKGGAACCDKCGGEMQKGKCVKCGSKMKKDGAMSFSEAWASSNLWEYLDVLARSLQSILYDSDVEDKEARMRASTEQFITSVLAGATTTTKGDDPMPQPTTFEEMLKGDNAAEFQAFIAKAVEAEVQKATAQSNVEIAELRKANADLAATLVAKEEADRRAEARATITKAMGDLNTEPARVDPLVELYLKADDSQRDALLKSLEVASTVPSAFTKQHGKGTGTQRFTKAADAIDARAKEIAKAEGVPLHVAVVKAMKENKDAYFAEQAENEAAAAAS